MLIAVRTRGRLAAPPDKSAEQPVRKFGSDLLLFEAEGGAAISHPLLFSKARLLPDRPEIQWKRSFRD